jgi:hypothetical protein
VASLNRPNAAPAEPRLPRAPGQTAAPPSPHPNRALAREQLVGLYHRVWAHSDAAIDALALDAVGKVPWWPRERREVTLHRILAHMIAETHRHAGHADIVRELIDGAVGLREGNDNMAPGDQAWWERYRSRLEHAARGAGSA